MKIGEIKNKQLKSSIGAVIGICVYFLVNQFLFPTRTYDEQLMKTASDLNKSCPIMVDKETRFDNAIALPDKTFQYYYTLINYTIDELDIEGLNTFLKKSLINTLKSNPDMENFRKNNVNVNYLYKDKNGIFITKISILPNEYK